MIADNLPRRYPLITLCLLRFVEFGTALGELSDFQNIILSLRLRDRLAGIKHIESM